MSGIPFASGSLVYTCCTTLFLLSKSPRAYLATERQKPIKVLAPPRLDRTGLTKVPARRTEPSHAVRKLQRPSMALVKTTELPGKGNLRQVNSDSATQAASSTSPKAGNSPRRALVRVRARQQKAAERIGAASEELASGVTEASSAAEELRRSMEQIATGAEEAAGASQQSLAAIVSLGTSFSEARQHAETTR